MSKGHFYHNDPKAEELVRLLSTYDHGTIQRAVAETVCEHSLKKWIEIFGIKPSASSNTDIRRLFGRRGHILLRDGDRPPGSDHESIWNLDGKPTLYVMQPYDLDIHKLVPWLDANGLRATVDTWPAWHYPGRVIHVSIATPDGWMRLDASRTKRNNEKLAQSVK